MKIIKIILVNFCIFAFLSAFTLYGFEAYFAYKEYEIELGTTERIRRAAEKQGAEWDKRSKIEVINDLRKEGKDAHPAMAPSVLVESNGLLIDGTEFFPFGGLSFATSVFCNEMGDWSIYQNDEHGFNNPKGSWNKEEIDLIFIGDSFTHGACLQPGDDIASQIRQNGFNTLNLGIGGTGPLIQLAVLSEYAKPTQPKIVFWVYYGVDIRDTPYEAQSKFLMKYLNDENFSQGLFYDQNLVDSLIRRYLENEYQVRLDQLSEARQSRRKIITDRLISQGLRLKKTRDRIANFGKPPLVEEGRESEKLDLLRKVISAAKKRTQSWGGKLVFVYLPDWYRYAEKYDTYGIKIDSNFLLRDDVIKMVNELNIPIIDTKETVFDIHDDPVSLYNWRMYGHYTLEGYNLVSNEITKYLDKNFDN